MKSDFGAAWSGTLFAHVSPEVPFAKEAVRIETLGDRLFVHYHDERSGLIWLFPVPETHLGEKNAVLVAHPGSYNLVSDGRYRIAEAPSPALSRPFPSSFSFKFLPLDEHGIPSAQPADEPALEGYLDGPERYGQLARFATISRHPKPRISAVAVGVMTSGSDSLGNAYTVDLSYPPSASLRVPLLAAGPSPPC